VNLERGVNDAGLTGETGQWSLRAFLAYIDAVHAAGRTVVLDAFDDTAVGRKYNLAAYFLVSGGDDGVGLASMTPDNWWAMYNVDLGAPQGARMSRRTFWGATSSAEWRSSTSRALPSAPLSSASGWSTAAAAPCRRSPLDGGRGAVLRRPTRRGGNRRPAATAAGSAVVTATVLAKPKPAAKDVRRGATTSQPTRNASAVGRRPRRRATRVLVGGRVRGADSGRVRLRVERITAGRSRSVRRSITELGARGAFRLRMRAVPRGRYRFHARYLGSPTVRPSSARPRHLRVR
jgi:hypothetical protein